MYKEVSCLPNEHPQNSQCGEKRKIMKPWRVKLWKLRKVSDSVPLHCQTIKSPPLTQAASCVKPLVLISCLLVLRLHQSGLTLLQDLESFSRTAFSWKNYCKNSISPGPSSILSQSLPWPVSRQLCEGCCPALLRSRPASASFSSAAQSPVPH